MKSQSLATYAALILLAAAGQAAAQTPPPAPARVPCAEDPKFRELDFWVGNWTVHGGPQPDARKSADVVIAKILGECALEETWDSERPTGDGKGLATYNRLTGLWGYYWVSGSGANSDFTGNLVDPKQMRFVIEQPTANGGKRLRHWTLFAMPDGRVRELSVGSDDSGKTWTQEYDLYWTRK
jgi:hypothetical protein